MPELGPPPAPAPAPAAPGEASTERVVVTGSYIPTAEEVTASPLDTLTSQEVARAGTSDVLQVLQKRNPDFVGAGNIGGTNANTSSGATLGGSVVQIRGLPSLVLFKGRRIADSAAIAVGGAQFADVSLFPAALLSRIEVLKDGASALYGSEAVGGVINIFTKDDFQGVELGLRYGFSVESGVAERRAYGIAGVGNETTQVSAGYQYFEQDGLFQRERAYSRIPGPPTTTYAGVGRDQGGGASQFYLLDPALNSPFDAPGVVSGAIPPPPPAGANPGQYAQLPQAYDLSSQAAVQAFDLTTLPTSTIDQSRHNALASFNHQIFGKQLELFGDFLFAKTHNQLYLNGQPLSNATGVLILGTQRVLLDPETGAAMLVPEDRGAPAAFNPFQLSLDTNTLAGRYRLFAGQRYQNHPRTFTTDSTFYRWLAGLRSNFAKDWTAEAAAYYSNYSINF
ncbi:MAG TPA: TonB-dependent receptor plug domain-containing protein, partial [Chthoniobacterales bacterium]